MGLFSVLKKTFRIQKIKLTSFAKVSCNNTCKNMLLGCDRELAMRVILYCYGILMIDSPQLDPGWRSDMCRSHYAA